MVCKSGKEDFKHIPKAKLKARLFKCSTTKNEPVLFHESSQTYKLEGC